MATSGTTNFSVSRDDLIKGALRKIGVVPQGETPTADQITEGGICPQLNGEGMGGRWHAIVGYKNDSHSIN